MIITAKEVGDLLKEKYHLSEDATFYLVTEHDGKQITWPTGFVGITAHDGPLTKLDINIPFISRKGAKMTAELPNGMLKEKREALGLTKEQLATILELQPLKTYGILAISYWESQNKVFLQNWPRVAAVLNIPEFIGRGFAVDLAA